jgi:hypothetical protein
MCAWWSHDDERRQKVTTVDEGLEAVGVRPTPRRAQASRANARAATVAALLRRGGIVPKPKENTAQGVRVYAYLPHTARVEVTVRNARLREVVITRLREVLRGGGYEVSRTEYVRRVVLYATKDAPPARVPKQG